MKIEHTEAVILQRRASEEPLLALKGKHGWVVYRHAYDGWLTVGDEEARKVVKELGLEN